MAAGAKPTDAAGTSNFPSIEGQEIGNAPIGRQRALIGLQNPDCAQAAAASGASENTVCERAPVDHGTINPAGRKWVALPFHVGRRSPGSRRARPATSNPTG